ncbi:hypothetical protein AAVH_37234 [Aphelenchoides avenae]|nr:hypothetical protein AAVH_37234 [Aphelenchus avenae]
MKTLLLLAAYASIVAGELHGLRSRRYVSGTTGTTGASGQGAPLPGPVIGTAGDASAADAASQPVAPAVLPVTANQPPPEAFRPDPVLGTPDHTGTASAPAPTVFGPQVAQIGHEATDAARNTAGEAIAAGFSGGKRKRDTVGAPVPLSAANAAIMDHSGLVMAFQTDPLVPRQNDSPPDQETKDLPDSLMSRARRDTNAQKIASEAQAKIVSTPAPVKRTI